MPHRAIATAVVDHYAQVRRDLPWRRTRDPYAIWVSEIMLQQTRVATVIPYWERWMARFPTVSALAGAPLDDVLASWAGLGYYSRARNLHKGAQAVHAQLGGRLPDRAEALRAVPGIGPYTAGAIASIAFGERAPLVDGNVARVLARVFAIEHDIKSTAGGKALWAAAGELMRALPDAARPGDLNQGLMELGATICAPSQPRCLVCPLARDCAAHRTGRQDELPVVAARKKQHELPLIERTAVWIAEERAGEIALVLARRRPDGLFGGLWELPELDLVAALGATIDRTPVAHHDQVLTHRRLRITVVRGALADPLVAPADPRYDALVRVTIAEARTLGIAAATAAILQQYKDTPWSSMTRPSHSSPRATRRSSKASAASDTTRKTPTSPRPRRARPRASTSSSTTRTRSRPK
ncbi:MAG TPA: A/G-specific adenine glycosylase [Kofleriaceae bacterium]|nr:A/G-specific adenine glycosylase [Kofleriaceae bacterium]